MTRFEIRPEELRAVLGGKPGSGEDGGGEQHSENDEEHLTHEGQFTPPIKLSR
jgi:hypothetical protein